MFQVQKGLLTPEVTKCCVDLYYWLLQAILKPASTASHPPTHQSIHPSIQCQSFFARKVSDYPFTVCICSYFVQFVFHKFFNSKFYCSTIFYSIFSTQILNIFYFTIYFTAKFAIFWNNENLIFFCKIDPHYNLILISLETLFLKIWPFLAYLLKIYLDS